MALETLEGIDSIDGFDIQREVSVVKRKFIYINEEENVILFRLQKGSINEFGKNGVPIETMINTAKLILEGLNKQHASRYNKQAIQYLIAAEEQLHLRKVERYAEIDDEYELNLS